VPSWGVRTIAVVVLVLLSTTARADDWPAAQPQGWHAQGFGKVAEMFPRKSRHNPSDKPVLFVYDVPPGATSGAGAKLAWKATLPNREAPYEAIVSTEGHVVLLDDWANLGHDNAVVIYDPKGTLIARKKLDDLVPAAVANRDRSVSSRYWRNDAKYRFDLEQKLLQIQLKGGETVQLSLATGKHSYFATNAPKLRRIEDTQVWPLNLRFSSITDLQVAPPPKPPIKKQNPY
jgi:hypothetical protein